MAGLSSTAALRNQRLYNTRLAAPFRSAQEAIAWFGAVQAQDYAGAKWALAQRLRRSRESELERALDSGSILRTHVLRPTWHFVLPADIRWMLKLTAPRIRTVMSYYHQQLELDESTFRRSNSALGKALQGGKHLTRAELGRVLEGARIRASGPRLGLLLMRAEIDAVVCSGPRGGKQLTYALLEERAPKARALARDEALAELSRRYVKSHGPCLVHDFAWWSGLSVGDAKKGFASIASELWPRLVNEKTYWSAKGERAARRSAPSLHLLPNFDEYLVAYKDQSLALDGALARELSPRGNVLGGHIVIIDGRVAGGWRRTLGKAKVSVEVTLLAPLERAQKEALTQAAERYAAYLELPLELRALKLHRKAAR
jgi:hypothetical protein